MKNLIYLFVITALLVSCNQANKNYGENSSPDKRMESVVAATIEELLAEPSDYEGKEVAVSGMVTHVCKHGGQKCFVLAEDGESQLRINVGEDIDEFETGLEGSNVAFKGVFRVLNSIETESNVEDHDSQEHHSEEMAHTEAEKSSYYIEAADYREISQ